jgi:hypothetical protein
VTPPSRRQILALANRAPNRRQHRPAISCHRLIIWTVVLALLSWIHSSSGLAEDVSKKQMQGLDEQVQEIKSDVLSIAAGLSRLEERLLYPSNTQVAVFVSLAEGETFRLDSVQIQIDGELVAHHIYSFKELEALQKGGVVSVAGKLPGGRDFSGTESFSFRKDVEPKLVGMTLAASDSGDASIQLGGW